MYRVLFSSNNHMDGVLFSSNNYKKNHGPFALIYHKNYQVHPKFCSCSCYGDLHVEIGLALLHSVPWEVFQNEVRNILING